MVSNNLHEASQVVVVAHWVWGQYNNLPFPDRPENRINASLYHWKAHGWKTVLKKVKDFASNLLILMLAFGWTLSKCARHLEVCRGGPGLPERRAAHPRHFRHQCLGRDTLNLVPSRKQVGA